MREVMINSLNTFRVLLTVFLAGSINPQESVAQEALRDDLLVCRVKYFHKRSVNSNIVTEFKEEQVLSVRIKNKMAIILNSNKFSESEKTYSNSLCVDSSFYSSWAKVWRERKKEGQGCSANVNFSSDVYSGSIYEEAGFSSSYQESQWLKINRITGSFEEVRFLYIPNSFDSRQWHEKTGTCEKSRERF
jgi:hypothetical protein